MAKRILALSGSLRRGSSNTALLRHAQRLAPGGVEIEIFEGLDALPFFNPDREHEPNEAVDRWKTALKGADAVLISTPEYAHGIPGVLKNALDWVVGSGEMVGKAVGILDSTYAIEGPSSAQRSLVEILGVMSADIVVEGSLKVPALRSKLDNEGILKDPGLDAALPGLLLSLASHGKE